VAVARPARGVKTAGWAVAQWARRHLAAWILGAGALTTALATLLAVLIALPNQPDRTVRALFVVLVIVLVLSVAFPVTSRVVEKRDQRVEQERRRQELASQEGKAQLGQVDRLLIRGSVAILPRLSELTDDVLGATPTIYSIERNSPYVSQHGADETIRGFLCQPGPPYPFVVVWGTTKTGKSRTLAEALRATFSDAPIVVLPKDGQALAELSHLGISNLVGHRPAVVVMDDLDPAGLEALTAEVLATVRSWAVIAATMTSRLRAEVLTSRDVGTIARAALAAATGEYEMRAGPPTGAEKEEAERLYPGERFDGSIAETLVGARELIARYRSSFDTNPAGCALIRAAIDIRRAGITRPITEAELWHLFHLYLPAIRTGLAATREQFTKAVEWAVQPVASQVALLRPVNAQQETRAWTVFDHAVTSDDTQGSQHRSIPADTWSELIDILPSRDTPAVGLAAYARGDVPAAIAAMRKATTSENASVVAAAAFALGVMLTENEDKDGAKTFYQLAIDTGNTQIAAIAAVNLGALLADLGDVDGARTAYQLAIDSGHPDQAPKAGFNLGNLLRDLDDADGARTAYVFVIGSRHADAAPNAALSLGNLLYRHGDVNGARAAYQLAADSGHPNAAPNAAINLGNVLKEQHDAAGARTAYQRAIDSGHPELVAPAAVNLGLLLDQHDDEAARVAYQLAIDSGHPDQAPKAALNLGVLFHRRGDLPRARAAYQLAIDSGHLSQAPMAALSLGNLLKDKEDIDGARAAYQLAIDSGHLGQAPMTIVKLELFLGNQLDDDGAQEAYHLAVKSGHADLAPVAALNLGVLLHRQGDLPRARAAYQLAIDSGHPDVAAAARRLLGEL
jgi:tetratricopeptide (TPR) repeat protein